MKYSIVALILILTILMPMKLFSSAASSSQLPQIQVLDRNGHDLGDMAPHAEQVVLWSLRDILNEYFLQQGTQPHLIPQQVNELIDSSTLAIYTTLDVDIQMVAQQAVINNLPNLTQSNAHNAAVVVLDPTTDEILGMIGNVDYNNPDIDGSLNMATLHREPATALMPFVYATAFEYGWTGASAVWDTRTVFDLPDGTTFQPINFSRVFHGPTQIRDSLASSYSAPAAQVLHAVGVEKLVSVLRRLGMKSVDPDDPIYDARLAVGQGVSLTLLELTSAYAVLANDGQFTASKIIRCVLDTSTNSIIYELNEGCPIGNSDPNTDSIFSLPTTVLDPRIAFIISDILADPTARSLAFGADSPLNTPFPSAIKTGTSESLADGWAIGYTPSIVVGVWAGNSDQSQIQNASGLTIAGPIWRDTIEGVISGLNWLNRPFTPPTGLTSRQVCRIDSLRDPVVSCPNVRQEWFFDTPVRVPNANGDMIEVVPVADDPSPEQQRYRLDEIFPGVIQTDVRPLNEQEIATYLSNYPESTPPRYCLVPLSAINATVGTTLQLFVKPPPDLSNSLLAYDYAITNGFAILPRYSCEFELFSSTPNLTVDPILQTGDYEVNPSDPSRSAAIFCRIDGSIDIWQVVNGQGTPWFTATADIISAVPSRPAQNTLVMQGGEIRLYRLTSGEFQVNAPRDGDPNGYVFIWGGCGLP